MTARLVGAEFFAGMARAYADAEKPNSPLMFDYGDGFAAFIAGFAPASGLAYLADVARIEAALTRAYNAEDAAAMTLAQLADIALEALGGTRLARASVGGACAIGISGRFDLGRAPGGQG